MSLLVKEVIEALRDPESIKTLTTIGDDGVPHTVFKDSLTTLDGENLVYIELLETGTTQRNMLKNFWKREPQPISITLRNNRMKISYEIIGVPDRFMYEGPIWEEMLDRIWRVMPDTSPSGVWLIIPKKVVNEGYEVRREEEAKRRPGSQFWLSIHGWRP